jgi:hypothetical protein
VQGKGLRVTLPFVLLNVNMVRGRRRRMRRESRRVINKDKERGRSKSRCYSTGKVTRVSRLREE